MKPGRELDTLVAEKVMGMKLRNLTETSCELWHEGKWHPCGPCARYSTSIADAWLVVEKVEKEHYPFILTVDRGIAVCIQAEGVWHPLQCRWMYMSVGRWVTMLRLWGIGITLG